MIRDTRRSMSLPRPCLNWRRSSQTWRCREPAELSGREPGAGDLTEIPRQRRPGAQSAPSGNDDAGISVGLHARTFLLRAAYRLREEQRAAERVLPNHGETAQREG